MCGRIKLTPLNQGNRELLGVDRAGSGIPDINESISRNGQALMLIRSSLAATGTRLRALPVRWGLETHNNAVHFVRSETALLHPMFAEAMQYRRCAIMVEGWWEGKHYVRAPGYNNLPMLALWHENLNGSRRFAIMTRAAPPSLIEIHPRTPLVGDLHAWLRNGQYDLGYVMGFAATKEAA